MTNQEVSDPALPLVLELISKIRKIDSKRYSCNLKTEHGKLKLEVVDNNEFKQPEIRNIAQQGNVTVPTNSARAERPAERVIPTSSTRAKATTRGTGRWDFSQEKRYETRFFDSRTQSHSDSTRNFDFRNFNKTTKRKSPSEKGRDKNRLHEYLSNPVPNQNSDRLTHSGRETTDNSCQTSHIMETSNKLIQAAATLHHSHSQTPKYVPPAVVSHTASQVPSPQKVEPENRPGSPGSPPHLRRCDECDAPPKPGTELKKCSICKRARYCSVNCQSADWPLHRRICGLLRDQLQNT